MNVWDQAALEMPEAIRTNAEEHVSRIAAADFFDGASLPVIPQTKGREMVFSLMREELADASRLAANQMRQGVSFVLREPDYQIELVIPAFQTVTLQVHPCGRKQAIKVQRKTKHSKINKAV